MSGARARRLEHGSDERGGKIYDFWSYATQQGAVHAIELGGHHELYFTAIYQPRTRGGRRWVVRPYGRARWWGPRDTKEIEGVLDRHPRGK